MKVNILFFSLTSVLLMIGLVGCESPSVSNSDIQVNQTNSTSETTSEIIRLNNCGNPASSDQESARSQAVTVTGAGKLGLGNEVVEASISAQYADTRTLSKSMKVTAAPNTNMEFVLLWTEKVNTGFVTVQGSSGQAVYRVSIPLQVELASANNLGCTSIQGGITNSRINIPGEIWTADFKESHKYEQREISSQDFSNFTFEADVRINDTASEYHGLMFGLQSNDKNFFSFRITPDGIFAFDVWRESPDSSFTRVLGPSNSNSILTGAGQVNHLKVIANGGNFEFFINNQKVGSITDNSFPSGKVGFVSCTCGGASSASATFLNAIVIQNP